MLGEKLIMHRLDEPDIFLIMSFCWGDYFTFIFDIGIMEKLLHTVLYTLLFGQWPPTII